MKKNYTIFEKLTTFKLALALILLNGLFANAADLKAVGGPVTTNSGSGLSASYPSLAAAVTALNAATITSPVIIDLNTPEIAPVGGYAITAIGSATNTITIDGNNNVVTANAGLTAGSLTDAIFKLVGADYITLTGFTMIENPLNTLGTVEITNTMTEWGVALLYASTTNGAQNNTITNNTITLNRTYRNTFGIYSNSTHAATTPATSVSATGIDGSNTGLVITSNLISNVNLGIVVVGPILAVNHAQMVTIGGSPTTGNTITDFATNVALSNYQNVSATSFGIVIRNTANFMVSHNTITSSNGGYTNGGAIRGIFVAPFQNAPTGTLSQTINNNTISIRPGASAAITGIEVGAVTGNATTSLSISNNDFNTTTHTVAAPTAAITFINNLMANLNTDINGNTFTNMSVNTSGAVNFILNNVARPANAVCNVNNNSVVTGFIKSVAGGAVTFYSSNAATAATATETNTGNNFSNISTTGATAINGWISTEGATTAPFGSTKTVSNNTFTNIVAGTSASAILTVSNGNGGATANSLVANNTINNIAAGGTIVGITSAQGKQTFSGNTITNIVSTVSGIASGMSITGGASQTVQKNKIANIEVTNALGVVNGLLISNGLLVNVYNNVIGDLRTPIRSAATDGVRGISITSTAANSSINVFNNSIALAAVSTGTDFSTAGIFHTANATATTAALNLRNNIIANASVAAGTGTSVAFRRSSTALGNYAATSDNNDLVATTIMADGTNFPITIAAYQALVAPRDAASITAIPAFLSTVASNAAFLRIDASVASPIQNGGSSIAAITDDIDGDIRQGAPGYTGTGTAPDLGADEVELVIASNVITNGGSGLAITYTSLDAAITALNAATISSPVIITLNVNETAPATGYVVTAEGSATNTIIIQGLAPTTTVTANAGLTAGAINDGIFKLMGADYITLRNFTIIENPLNTTSAVATNNMTEWGVALMYATTTNGAQNNTIQGNTISLNRAYANTFGIYSNSTHDNAAPTTSASATTAAGSNTGLSVLANSISNVNFGITVVGPTADADFNQSLTIGSLGFGNTITDFGTDVQASGYANISSNGYGISVRNTANYDVNYNTLTSSVGGYAGTAVFYGILVPAFSVAPTGTLVQNINNNSVSLQSGAATAPIANIYVEPTTGNATTTLSISNNNIVATTHTVAATALIVFIGNESAVLNTNINGNTFTNLSVNTSGGVTFISNDVTRPAGAVCNVNNNSVVTAFNKTVAGGTVAFYNSFSSSLTGVTETNTGNNFSNMTFTGATTIIGWRSGDGSTTSPFGPNKVVSNNTFSNIVCGTNAAVMLQADYSNAAGNSAVSNNTISNINGGGTVIGIVSTQGKQLFSGNTITGITSTGLGAAAFSITNGSEQTLTKNKIANLETNSAGGFIWGINIASGTTVNVMNNIIGDLRAPITSSAADGIRGINISSTLVNSNINVYNNTIALAGVSTGTDFSASGIFHAANATATTAALDLRNNIIVNTSVANGTGTSVALRRSSAALANFASTSNNNDLVAAVLMADGTNSPATLVDYQMLVAPRETATISAAPSFLSLLPANANFLHIDTTIQTGVESGGSAIASVTDDFDGNIRQGIVGYSGTGTAPDMGADEFEGLPLGIVDFDSATFSAYPNPTTGILNINATVEISEVTVFNMLGQSVMSKKANALDVQIDLSSMSRGTYLVKVIAEGQEKVLKVLKQ